MQFFPLARKKLSELKFDKSVKTVFSHKAAKSAKKKQHNINELTL